MPKGTFEHVPAVDGDEGLEGFYKQWSEKSPALVLHDVTAAARKADIITSRIPRELLSGLDRVLDFGCGYGAFLARFSERLDVREALGVDFSEAAVRIACERFGSDRVRFETLPTLDPEGTGAALHSLAPSGVDCILLIDLLEHVPDCRALMAVLSRTSRTFVIKLPLENSVFENYVRRKEYPSTIHSNGHLREFNVNDVHYFIRALGLTPLFEDVYLYALDEQFPPPPERLPMLRRLKRGLHKAFWRASGALLPKRAFLRLVGGGGYFCIAIYDEASVLEP